VMLAVILVIVVGWQLHSVSPLLPACKITVQSRRARAQRAEAPVREFLRFHRLESGRVSANFRQKWTYYGQASLRPQL
jgi:hypothetical protein